MPSKPDSPSIRLSLALTKIESALMVAKQFPVQNRELLINRAQVAAEDARNALNEVTRLLYSINGK